MQLKTRSTQNSTLPIALTDSKQQRPDPEVPEKKSRRRFTAQYKLRILKQIDECSQSGDVGAILRREGLYYSNITTWRKQLQKGALKGLAPKKRGRKKKAISPEAKRLAELERENKKLTRKLKQAETIIEFQKKISEILSIDQNDNDEKQS